MTPRIVLAHARACEPGYVAGMCCCGCVSRVSDIDAPFSSTQVCQLLTVQLQARTCRLEWRLQRLA